MSAEQYLTLREAAEICGVSVDTLRRDRRSGLHPQSRVNADGAVAVSVADLVTSGRLDALAALVTIFQIECTRHSSWGATSPSGIERGSAGSARVLLVGIRPRRRRRAALSCFGSPAPATPQATGRTHMHPP